MRQTSAFSYARRYRGPVQAVILDWAGTVMDFGCLAPAHAFVELFRQQGVAISLAEARGPMGLYKRAHIEQLTRLDAVRARWRAAHGRDPDEDDVEAMFQAFVPLQLECLSAHAALIPGARATVDALRARGIRIGSTTGYTAEMTAINLADARRQGYAPDSTVSASEMPAGRPYPFMCLQNVINLQVECVAACVKVDDTVPGIEEGLNAGMWSIGVTVSGNEVGLSLADWQALDPAAQAALRAPAARRLRQAGAHYVIDSIADLPPCIDAIEARLAHGEQP
jgi:phosphonoacetaldehyde hydrolase